MVANVKCRSVIGALGVGRSVREGCGWGRVSRKQDLGSDPKAARHNRGSPYSRRESHACARRTCVPVRFSCLPVCPPSPCLRGCLFVLSVLVVVFTGGRGLGRRDRLSDVYQAVVVVWWCHPMLRVGHDRRRPIVRQLWWPAVGFGAGLETGTGLGVRESGGRGQPGRDCGRMLRFRSLGSATFFFPLSDRPADSLSGLRSLQKSPPGVPVRLSATIPRRRGVSLSLGIRSACLGNQL